MCASSWRPNCGSRDLTSYHVDHFCRFNHQTPRMSSMKQHRLFRFLLFKSSLDRHRRLGFVVLASYLIRQSSLPCPNAHPGAHTRSEPPSNQPFIHDSPKRKSDVPSPLSSITPISTRPPSNIYPFHTPDHLLSIHPLVRSPSSVPERGT